MKITPRLGLAQGVAKSPTISEVIAAVDGLDRLSPGRRGDLKTACRKVAKILGRHPVEITVDIAEMREKLETVLPAHYGMTPKRWSTIRSDFVGALRLTGLAEPLATSMAVLTYGWSAFLGQIRSRDHRTSLSRFARFCSLQAVEPSQVENQILEQFAAALSGASLVRKPGHILRKTARSWNASRGEGPSAIGQALMVQSNRPPARRVQLSALQESFRRDLGAWLNWLEAKDPFAPNARDRPLRGVTIKGYRDKVIAAVTAAVEGNIEVSSITSLAYLVEPEVFKTILRRRNSVAENKPSPQAQAIATVLLVIAKTWCQAPDEQVKQLRLLRSKLPALRAGMVEKNRKFLNTFEDPRLFARLLAIPDKLWLRATSGKLSPERGLVAAQLSLLIDIVTVVPLRLKNLCSLSFANNLSWPLGPKGPALLFVPGSEMKNGEDYQAELSADLARRLLVYRDQLAPSVLGSVPQDLFVTRQGNRKSMTTIAVEFKAIIALELGISMTLHQTRHLAAKVLLDAHPEAYPLVQQLLGHRNLSTTVKTYAGVNTRRASREYAAVLETMKSAPITRASGPVRGQLKLPRQFTKIEDQSLGKPEQRKHEDTYTCEPEPPANRE